MELLVQRRGLRGIRFDGCTTCPVLLAARLQLPLGRQPRLLALPRGHERDTRQGVRRARCVASIWLEEGSWFVGVRILAQLAEGYNHRRVHHPRRARQRRREPPAPVHWRVKLAHRGRPVPRRIRGLRKGVRDCEFRL